MTREFILCGHRGNWDDSPENTLISFASAERVGVDAIELDVRITKDGELVIMHDRTSNRTAATRNPYVDIPIEELTFEQVRSIDMGDGQKIPTLAETLDLTTVQLQVEIKAPDAARPLARMLRERPAKDRERCLITSFDSLSLAEYQDEWDGTPMGVAYHIPDPTNTWNWRDTVRSLHATTVMFPLDLINRPLVDEMHEKGYKVEASLIEGAGEVRRIVEMDVDMSATNKPEYARHLCLSNKEFMERFPTFGKNHPVTA